tara:strand:- start:146 stop:478 length:333 start_codon:yes stop_codon:yes gene_type:complete
MAIKRAIITTNATTSVVPLQSSVTEDAWENSYGRHTSLHLCNADNVDVTVSVVYTGPTTDGVDHILVKTIIPPSVTLVLTDGLDFDNSVYALRIITAAASGTPILHYSLN